LHSADDVATKLAKDIRLVNALDNNNNNNNNIVIVVLLMVGVVVVVVVVIVVAAVVLVVTIAVSSEHLHFFSFFITVSLFGSMREIKLVTHQLLGAR